MPQRRNFTARAPIMRKGGVHQKSRSAERSINKRTLQREIRSYLAQSRNKKGAEWPPSSLASRQL